MSAFWASIGFVLVNRRYSQIDADYLIFVVCNELNPYFKRYVERGWKNKYGEVQKNGG